MPQYLMEIAYTPQAMAALVANPQDRRDAVKPAIEKLGGTLEHAWFALGECDVVLIASFPDNSGALSFSSALSAGGAVRAVKTIPLLNIAEGVDALKRAATCGYQPMRRTTAITE
jgi:uncharacterized protein with GYD domain